MRKFLPLTLLIMAALACALPFEIFTPPPLATPQPPLGATSTPQLATPIPSLTPVPPTPNPDTPAITFEQVASMQVYAPTYQQTVTLVNGVYDNPGDPVTMAGRLYVALLPEHATGDLNGDGAEDLAVMLAENGGGSGTFVSLIVFLNRGGMPVQTAQTLIDDRPAINALSIADGQITVDAIIHGFEDPGCCPTFDVTQAYRLFGNRLVRMRLSSRTPAGDVRIITLDSPQEGQRVSGVVRLTGSVTIAPFENNLACVIFDAQTDAQLAAYPCLVNAPDLGAPGTFDIQIPLDSVPAGRLIRIELQDQNMADGSLLAMTAVTLQVP